jgi:hypothetical protein
MKKSNNSEMFKKEVKKQWKNIADKNLQKHLKDADLDKIMDFLMSTYQSNPDNQNFAGELEQYVKDKIDLR